MKGIHIALRLGIGDFKASSALIGGFKWWHSIVYKTVLEECRNVDSFIVEERWKEQLFKFTEGYEPKRPPL
jgi:hypothetical protein